MATRGPLVRREARWGGALLAAASLQFVAAMIVVEAAWPGYSPVAGYISDLGNPNTSPLPGLFDASIAALGVAGVVGTYLWRTAFPPKTRARIGLAALVVASIGAIGVGIFPETSPELGGQIHGLVSLLTFLGSGFALLLLAVGMLRDTRWEGYRAYTALSGAVTLGALAAYLAGTMNSEVAGLVERVVVAPILLWAIVAGIHVARLPTYAPSTPSAAP